MAVVADEFGNSVHKTGMNEKEPNLFLRGTMPAAIFRSLVCRCRRYSIFLVITWSARGLGRVKTRSGLLARGGDAGIVLASLKP